LKRRELRTVQIIVNNYNKFDALVEGLAWVAELICRHVILERLYLGQVSKAAEELQRALVTLYTGILIYLSKVKQYLQEGTGSEYLSS
jgi:hypothetical protein